MKIESAFLCDDVRREGNGKLIFIGVYAQDIILPAFPITLGFHVVLLIDIDRAGLHAMEVEVLIDDKSKLKGSIQITQISGGFSFIHFPIPQLTITGESKLNVRVKDSKGKWNKVLKIDIKQGNPNQPVLTGASTESPPPS
ncbi:MAG: hypothetical protein ABI705_09545 [Aestuariivirga sp.]